MKIHSPKHNIRRSLSKGFTLLEIVIVLGIIAVIIGGSIVGLNKLGDGAKIQRAEADFGNLKAAVLNYKMLAGNAPTTQQGLEALFVKPTSPPIPKRWTSAGTKGVPLDPWNVPYRYRNPGKKDASDFEIYTFGPDGLENTDDDMSSQD
jgi:general secretion pathway protein G